MKINKIKINNILGIENFEFHPSKFTLIEGKNGSGKTSILEAIKTVFKGGSDATLIKNGSEKGEIVFVLNADNGTDIMVTKTIKGGSSSLSMIDSNGNKINKPKDFLDTLSDMVSVNPISFLTADKKERTKILLELLPSEILDFEKLNGILKENKLQNLIINYNESALEILDKYHNAVFSERTSLNRSIKDKIASKSQLSESLVEVAGDEIQIKDKLNELETKQQKLNDLKLDKEQQVLQWYQSEINRINEEKENKLNLIKEKFELNVGPVKTEIIQLNEQLKLTSSFAKTKELINQFSNEIANLEKDTNKLTESITEINEIKKEILDNLPFDNLQVREGEIYKNEIPFDRLNEAEKVKIAVQIAQYKAGELGIICVDGIERLDTNTFENFKNQALEKDLQLIVTKVSDTDLQVINMEKSNSEESDDNLFG